MRLSKKLANLLFGKHHLNCSDDGLSVQEELNHPDGRKIIWPGNDGLVFTIYTKIQKLELEIEELKNKKLK